METSVQTVGASAASAAWEITGFDPSSFWLARTGKAGKQHFFSSLIGTINNFKDTPAFFMEAYGHL